MRGKPQARDKPKGGRKRPALASGKAAADRAAARSEGKLEPETPAAPIDPPIIRSAAIVEEVAKSRKASKAGRKTVYTGAMGKEICRRLAERRKASTRFAGMSTWRPRAPC